MAVSEAQRRAAEKYRKANVKRLITSQIDTAPKRLPHMAHLPLGLITSQIDTAPKPCSMRFRRITCLITSQIDTAPKPRIVAPPPKSV